MKKYCLGIAAVVLAAVWFVYQFPVSAQRASGDADVVSNSIVISQFQTGRASPNLTDEFVEIHNVSAAAIDLNGYRLVYRSQNGSGDVGPFALWSTSTVIPAGGYYLVASTDYDGA